jgi:hypothetical protein
LTALIILLGKNGLNQSHSNEKEKEKGSIREMETFLVVKMEMIFVQSHVHPIKSPQSF